MELSLLCLLAYHIKHKINMSKFIVILEAYQTLKPNKPVFLTSYLLNLSIINLASRYLIDCF